MSALAELALPPCATPGAATLTLLWERMRQQGDMPAFTRAVGAILASMRGEQDAEFNLVRTVLSDPVLTSKVLRLANSGMYAAFGQEICTISRAVQVLGIDAIGHLALGLKVMDEAGGAHDEMQKAVLAGLIAREVAVSAGIHDEEALVCGMLHSLGRMMVAHYLPERWSAMQARSGAGNEEQAAPAILGMSLDDIGGATARQWGLPSKLVASMGDAAADERMAGRRASGQEAAGLGVVATLSARVAAALWRHGDRASRTIHTLAEQFAARLALPAQRIVGAVSVARDCAGASVAASLIAGFSQECGGPGLCADGAHRLLGGVADMREAAAHARPRQMMSMALEALYRGLGFTRAIGFVRSRREQRFNASMAFGAGGDALLPLLKFDDQYQADAFHAALVSDRVVYIRHALEPQFAPRLPGWWKEHLGAARSFVILPLCRNGEPVGFLYGDWIADLPRPELDAQQLAALDELRAMVVQTLDRRAA